MADRTVSEGKKARFKDGLKSHYKLAYSTVQPVRCSGGKHYLVSDIFQEVGVECLNTSRDPHRGVLWERLESYKSILSDKRLKSTKRIIEAPPGYGKSTLALQFAFDWCNTVKDSPMRDIDIVIFIQLKKFSDVASFPKLVKKMFFRKDSKISVKDIDKILLRSKSVLLILDAGRESIETHIKNDSDLHQIIKGEKYRHFEVILMARPISIDLSPSVKRLKLIGFDKRAQERYICTSLRDSNQAMLEKTKQLVLDNPVLGDYCKVPLLFALFSHLGHGNDNIQNFTTLTNFFNEIIKSFHHHFRQQGGLTEQFKKMDLFQNAHFELNKIAFDRLSEDNGDVEWGFRELNSLLDRNFVEHYLKTGILQIDEDLEVDLDSASEGLEYEKTVRFYYKMLTEWYAAQHLAKELSEELREEYVVDMLESFEPSQLQCLYRFACGINSAAANHIIKYLKISDDGELFSILCRVEQTGSIDGIRERIEEMFSVEYQIHERDTNFCQSTYIQLMEIAAREQIKIVSLLLYECFNTVDLYTGDLILTSHIHLPTLRTLEGLWIEQSRIHLSQEDIDGVFLYASNCPKVKSINFSNCFLPWTAKESLNFTKLKERQVKVGWLPGLNWHYLNFTTREWERVAVHVQNPITHDDYEKEKTDFDQMFPDYEIYSG